MPLNAGELTITNAALGDAKLSRITAEDQGDVARYATEQYPLVRDALQRRYAWNFCTERKSLAAIGAAPAHGFDRAFALPDGWLGVQEVVDAGVDDWRVEIVDGRTCITSDAAAPLPVILTMQVADVNRFPADFRMVLVTSLAIRLARRQGKEAALVADLKAELADILPDARTLDAQEGTPGRWADDFERDAFGPDDWIEARR
jgi:hypothetical protein